MRRSGPMVFAALLLAAFASAPPGSRALAQSAPSEFATSDLNHDGTVDRDEYRRRMVEVFYLDDKNKDGFVEMEELVVLGPVDSKAFAAADKNGDGRLTLQEFVEYRMVDFDQADTNHDGKLSPDEVAKWDQTHSLPR